MSIIEIRSHIGITGAVLALRGGDFADETAMTLLLCTSFFSSTTPQTTDVEEDFLVFMREFGRQASLKKMEVRPIAPPEDSDNNSRRRNNGSPWICRLPVKGLAAALETARGLESLSVEDMRLYGDEGDFNRLASSFQDHPALTSILLQCESLLRTSVDHGSDSDDDEDEDDSIDYSVDEIVSWMKSGNSNTNISPLDGTVRAFGSIDTLQRITFRYGKFPFDTLQCLSDGTIEALCRLDSLECLKIFGFLLTNRNLAIMANELVDKEALEELTLFCKGLGGNGFTDLHDIVSCNPNLDCFRLFILSFDRAPSRAITTGLEKVVQCVGKTQCTLFSLNVPSRYSNKAVAKVQSMIQGNYSLETVNLNKYKYGRLIKIEDNEVNFLLKANKMGRGQLFEQNECQNASVTWLSLFEATGGKLDNIYALVRSHPYEFADMGLNDCSQDMVPTIKIMKKMLNESNRKIAKVVKEEGLTIKHSIALGKRELDGTIRAYAQQNQKAMENVSDQLSEVKEGILEYIFDTQEVTTKSITQAVVQEKHEAGKAIQDALVEMKEQQAMAESDAYDKISQRMETMEKVMGQTKQEMEMLVRNLYMQQCVWAICFLFFLFFPFLIFCCFIVFKNGVTYY